jgi:hypothetical protein
MSTPPSTQAPNSSVRSQAITLNNNNIDPSTVYVLPFPGNAYDDLVHNSCGTLLMTAPPAAEQKLMGPDGNSARVTLHRLMDSIPAWKSEREFLMSEAVGDPDLHKAWYNAYVGSVWNGISEHAKTWVEGEVRLGLVCGEEEWKELNKNGCGCILSWKLPRGTPTNTDRSSIQSTLPADSAAGTASIRSPLPSRH